MSVFQVGHVLNKKVILGPDHFNWILFLMQSTWNICLQPSWILGLSPRPDIKQIEQNDSSFSSSVASGFVSTQSGCRQGKHFSSPKKPLHGCPHSWVL